MSQPQQPTPPPAPDPKLSYQQGTNVYLKNLPRYLNAEQQYRTQLDPQRIQEQQALQAQFGPTQYSQQLQALQQLDPQWFANNQALGTSVGANLANPENQAQYGQLRNNVFNDLSAGYGLAPGQEQQIEQGVRGAQAARGNSLGSAAGTAEAYALGDRGNQMYQQRLGNASNFLNLTSPYQRALNDALNYNQSATPSNMIQGIGPVTPDRSMAYVNPNAGFQGEQFALQNYQNQLAQMGLNQQPQNSVWGNIFGGIGGAVGSYYGGAAGGQAGYQTSSAIGNWI